MAFKKTFTASTEEVNSFGFWVLTAGIELAAAQLNCPAFYDHKTWEPPIGHWENLRVENAELKADLIIEGADDREKMYIRKIENGDIKGASIGADPLIWNESMENLKKGQTRPCLEKCELFEISLTPLPSNKSALALKKNGSLIVLNSDTENNIPNFKNEPNMKQIALKLGLSENATEQEILSAIIALSAKAASVDAMQKVIEDNVASALEGENKTFFVNLSKTNLTEAMNFLNLHKAPAADENKEETTAAPATTGKIVKDVKVSTLLNKGNRNVTPVSDENKECFDYLRKYNPAELSRIRTSEPEKYTQLAREYGEGVRYTGKSK